MRTDVNACDCTRRFTVTVRESLHCTLTLGQKSVAAPRNQTASSTYRSDALSTELHPHPSFDVGSVRKKERKKDRKKHDSKIVTAVMLSLLGTLRDTARPCLTFAVDCKVSRLSQPENFVADSMCRMITTYICDAFKIRKCSAHFAVYHSPDEFLYMPFYSLWLIQAQIRYESQNNQRMNHLQFSMSTC